MPALGFTGDVMLGRLVDEHQRRRPVDAVWGDLRDRLRALDGLLVNLECALSTRGEPWRETRHPYLFRADPDWAVPALEAAGVDYCSLANNHLLDFHEPALLDTLDHLDGAGVARAGAGRDREEARTPATFTVDTPDGDGIDVACVAFTDNTPEFAAGPGRPGVAYLDGTGEGSRAVLREALEAARADDPDLLVASLHWGPNMVAEPDEGLRALSRWLAGEGVDVVHGHSAHVFHGVEVHDGSLLCYDMGDFVDDYAVDAELRNDRSFLFEVVVDTDGTVEELRLHPTEIHDYAVHEAGERAATWSRERMVELSEPFGTDFERDGAALVCEVAA